MAKHCTPFLAAAVAVAAATASAQQPTAALTGQVLGPGGAPVAGARISVVEASVASLTDSAGMFHFSAIAPGRYTVTAHFAGLPATSKIVTLTAAAPASLALRFDAGPHRLEPVNITASRVPIDASAAPLPTSVLTGEDVDREGGVSLAHSLARLPGVRDVSTGQQIGKPMIRGLFGPRIIVLANGSRLEDYSWSDEDGPSIDARIAQRVEVIRGPASVLYGSDALSGVVNVIPADLPAASAGESVRRGAFETYAASNNLELGGAAMAEGARSRVGWRVTGTGRFSQNYQTPAGAVPNSSFWAFNAEGGLGIRDDRGDTEIRAAHYGGEFHLLEATGPEPGDPNGGPVRQVMDDRLQLTNNRELSGLRIETKAQFQRHSLAEVSDDCVPAPGQTMCTKVKDQQAFGLVLNTGSLDVLAHHTIGVLSGTAGVSGVAQSSNSTGPIFLVPGATVSSGAAFAFEQFALGRLSLVGGVRGDTRHLSSSARPEIGRAADQRSWNATSLDAGIIVRPMSRLSVVANYGTGWRAPTLFDLYANGPNLAEARFEIGDPTLRVERSKNIDGNLRWDGTRIRLDASVYRNAVDDFIFFSPTTEIRNGLRVFRHEQTEARLSGAEFSSELVATSRLTLRVSHDFVNGDDRTAGTPLPLMPPPRTIIGATFDIGALGGWRSVRAGSDVELDQTQRRLNPDDFPTSGYTLLNFDASGEHELRHRPARFDVLVRNALNVRYRDFLSRFKEFASGPGVNVVAKVSLGSW